ncbi:MAG: ATP-grasp domain-containing protein [Candidatus Promineifilaceae bacterium]|nr:ATP-grasp domain-containing protein [Candidatus Promineifilaceae bacterium]
MSEQQPFTILCLASYHKGSDFMEEAKALGCRVLLVTKEKLADEDWPRHAIDERFLMDDLTRRPDIIYAVSYLARTRRIDAIIPLDDFDVETTAALREHLRLPGMGDTLARFFRDKLAMRMQASRAGIRVPAFVPVINYDDLQQFMNQVEPPWVLKPRSQAGAMGIRKVHAPAELWPILDELGDRQSFFLLEEFVTGDIFHVDSIVSEKKIVFAEVHKYKQPPLTVSHEGGVFMTRTLPRDEDEVRLLNGLNAEILDALGMARGVSHAEFIKGSGDEEFYFLEVAARVGGANIAEMIEFATGVNLWREWARIEVAQLSGKPYSLPEADERYAGIAICLARQEAPDLSNYDAPEVVWRLEKAHHAGLIVASSEQRRIEQLLDEYGARFGQDFLTWVPPLDEAPA